MTTTVLPCPSCHLPVRLREGESTVQCTGCGKTVHTATAAAGAPRVGGGGEALRQTVLSVSLLVIASGFGGMALLRRHKVVRSSTPAPPTAIYTAPKAEPVAPTPEGELAWEPLARAPVLTAINKDGIEDVFGFFRLWDGRSAWVAHAGAFDGSTLKLLWQSDPIDPQLLKQPGVVPLAVVAGHTIVVADTSPTLRVFELASGEKLKTLKLSGSVMEICAAPEPATSIWVRVAGGGDTMIDLTTDRSDAAPRPKWCVAPAYEDAVVPHATLRSTLKERAIIEEIGSRKAAEVAACVDSFENGVVAHAGCRPPVAAGPEDGFVASYELTDGAITVAFGTKGPVDAKPFAVSRTKGSSWVHAFIQDDTQAKPAPPAIADLTLGRLYAVYERVYFDARLAALDAHTGELLWEVPLVGSLPGTEPGRGAARSLVATATRVYVARAGGGLDIFDATSGKPLGSIGKL